MTSAFKKSRLCIDDETHKSVHVRLFSRLILKLRFYGRCHPFKILKFNGLLITNIVLDNPEQFYF